MDDLKPYGRSKEELESLINVGQYIEMEFELDKCAVLNNFIGLPQLHCTGKEPAVYIVIKKRTINSNNTKIEVEVNKKPCVIII